jgi:hypothetical protein
MRLKSGIAFFLVAAAGEACAWRAPRSRTSASRRSTVVPTRASYDAASASPQRPDRRRWLSAAGLALLMPPVAASHAAGASTLRSDEIAVDFGDAESLGLECEELTYQKTTLGASYRPPQIPASSPFPHGAVRQPRQSPANSPSRAVSSRHTDSASWVCLSEAWRRHRQATYAITQNKSSCRGACGVCHRRVCRPPPPPRSSLLLTCALENLSCRAFKRCGGARLTGWRSVGGPARLTPPPPRPPGSLPSRRVVVKAVAAGSAAAADGRLRAGLVLVSAEGARQLPPRW